MIKNQISIIIPVYNTEKFLKKCIKSILAQKYKKLEIILINDGSTDKSPKICDSFAKKDKRIKVIHQDNKGASAARNVGLKIATGEYLSFIDSDDWISKNHFQLLIDDIKKFDSNFAISKFQFATKNIKTKYHSVKNSIKVSAKESYKYISYLDHDKPQGFGESAIYGKLFKYEIANSPFQILFDENLKLGEDFFWMAQYIERCEHASINFSITYFYRTNKQQTTLNLDKKFWYDFIEAKLDYLKKIEAPKSSIKRSELEYENALRQLFTNINKELAHKNKKMLFITRSILQGNTGGTRRTQQNINGCQEFAHCEIYTVKPIKTKREEFSNLLFYGNFQIRQKDIRNIYNKLNNQHYDYVFLDNSLYGKLCKKIKNKFPKIKIISHFHNVEEIYWREECQHFKKSIYKTYLRMAINKIKKSEKNIAKFSDAKIFISQKDKNTIINTHKINNRNDFIIPPCLKDNYSELNTNIINDPYVIFVGSAFFANFEAIKFIVEKIAPAVNIKTVILGGNLDKYFQNKYKNIEIIGSDENWNDLMNNALAFVSPIFSGSGAKIKTAEALMYGKKIIGTKDSFIGYEIEHATVCICDTAKDFIREYNKLKHTKKFFVENRQLFLEKYDMKINKKYYEKVFDKY